MQLAFSDYQRGAAVATDLVNTAARVRRSTGELLTDPAALAEFTEDRGLRPRRPTTDADVARVVDLRDRVRRVLESDGEDATVADANALLAGAPATTSLDRDADGRWQWHLTTPADATIADDLATLAAVGVLGTVRTLGHDRIRPCSSPTCDGVFVDTSRAGRRRYCTPDLCGNRLNVANHRARRRAQT